MVFTQENSLSTEQEQLASTFAQEGYVVLDLELSKEEMDTVLRDLNGKFQKGLFAYDTRIQNAWKNHESVLHIAKLPRILDLLRVLYQREPIPFQTLNFCAGTEQRGHSDAVHFHSLPYHFLCGVWVALEDIDAENGPLFYYPKSHTLPVIEPAYFNWKPEADYKKYENYIEQLIEDKGLERKELHIKKGQALIWAANLIHGGSRVLNKNRTRFSQVTHYYFENCIYYAPWGSNLALGNIQRKKITNISTSETVPHMCNGEVV